MTFIDHPRFLPLEAYTAAIERMCGQVRYLSGIRCVYQIGHVSTPGMSDIDLVVIFEDDASCDRQPRAGSSADEAYLFVHDLFGITRSHYAQALGYTFFHNYHLLAGEAPPETPAELPVSDTILLKQQTALEYLVRMYAALSVELKYGIVKLRSLFLLSKALLYDCEFLGIKKGPFYEAVQAIVARRQQWFQSKPPDASTMEGEIRTLHTRLGEMLSQTVKAHRFYLPPRNSHRIARHLRLVNGPELKLRHRGIHLPAALGKMGRRIFNFQHRLNRFDIQIPFATTGFPEPVRRLFELRQQMTDIRRTRFPHFMTLSSSLSLV